MQPINHAIACDALLLTTALYSKLPIFYENLFLLPTIPGQRITSTTRYKAIFHIAYPSNTCESPTDIDTATPSVKRVYRVK